MTTMSGPLGRPPAAPGGVRLSLLGRTAVRVTRRGYRGHGKRVLDLLVVLMVSLPVLLVLPALMALVALDGRSPFFVQKHVGRGGRLFPMLKLRTMVPDAEAVLAATLARDPALRAEWEHHQKLRRDPRITPIGALLRRTSLDELPQIVNVALGHMSIVGPRPMLPEQQDIYPGSEYYALRPGITGLWQISERNLSSFAERASYDRRYFGLLSLGTDLRIMLQTFRAVARATGC